MTWPKAQPRALLRFLVICCLFNFINCFIKVYPDIRQVPLAGDPGEPLFLSPLIEAGNIAEAVQRARVAPLPGDQGVISYAGYLTVNQTHNSNLFFWFFPAEVNTETAPLLLWLQGGPGSTSLYGLFTEHGPFIVNDDLTLSRREYPWSANYSVLYIDNPVGTGFSFSDADEGYARNQEDVGSHLYTVLLQFFQLFPDLQDNDFYITGESYAGKYVPAIAYTVHTRNPTAEQKINMKGIAIGNGLTDPAYQLNYADYMYQLGLIDGNARDRFRAAQELCALHIWEENYAAAEDVFDQLFNDLLNESGFQYYYNYLFDKDVPSGPFDLFVQQETVRAAIHVGNLTFNDGSEVRSHLGHDWVMSVKPWLEVLMDNYRTILYNGQLDIIVAYPLTDNFLQTAQWSAASEFKNATRYQWKVGDNLAGYAKTAGLFTEIMVRNAGHMVPTDQPVHAYDILNRLTGNIPFEK